jgi:hypothetical protein
MYENGKMRPVETIVRMGGEENDGRVNSAMIYCKHFCKCHNVLIKKNLMEKKKRGPNYHRHSFSSLRNHHWNSHK